jgi:hypothetical protein
MGVSRIILDAVVKKKIPSPRRSPIVQPVAQRYTDWVITALPDLYKSSSNVGTRYESVCTLDEVNKDLRERSYKDGRWVELPQDRVQW